MLNHMSRFIRDQNQEPERQVGWSKDVQFAHNNHYAEPSDKKEVDRMLKKINQTVNRGSFIKS